MYNVQTECVDILAIIKYYNTYVSAFNRLHPLYHIGPCPNAGKGLFLPTQVIQHHSSRAFSFSFGKCHSFVYLT